jgi:hypothetical protein
MIRRPGSGPCGHDGEGATARAEALPLRSGPIDVRLLVVLGRGLALLVPAVVDAATAAAAATATHAREMSPTGALRAR